MERDNDVEYQAEGLVSVWVGIFPDEAAHAQYFKEDWANQDDDEFSSCWFWKDLGIRWFDHDFQEAEFVGSPVPVAQLLALNWSHLKSFREPLLAKCAECGVSTANSLVFLYDYDYREGAGYSSPHMSFVGVFPYSKRDP